MVEEDKTERQRPRHQVKELDDTLPRTNKSNMDGSKTPSAFFLESDQLDSTENEGSMHDLDDLQVDEKSWNQLDSVHKTTAYQKHKQNMLDESGDSFSDSFASFGNASGASFGEDADQARADFLRSFDDERQSSPSSSLGMKQKSGVSNNFKGRIHQPTLGEIRE